jgi:hypothetical protein
MSRNTAIENLKYPLDGGDTEEYKAQIRFKVIKEPYLNKYAEKAFEAGLDAAIEGQESISPIDVSSIKERRPFNDYTGSQVILYMPQGLQFRDNVVYDNIDLGTIGALVEGGASLGAGMAEGIKGGVRGLIDSFKGDGLSNVAMVGAQKVASKFGTEFSAGLRSRSGVTANPNSRTLFKQPNIREFSYSFKMIAKSSDEAEMIRKIVKLFRNELYPASFGANIGGQSVGFGYEVPNKFGISFYYGNKKMTNIPKMPKCFLRDVNINYNSSSMAMHSDGNFLEVDMTLSFVEERALTKEDIVSGY